MEIFYQFFFQKQNQKKPTFTAASVETVHIVVSSYRPVLALPPSCAAMGAVYLFVCLYFYVSFYRTRVRSLATLVITNSLTHCRLIDLIEVTLACVDANSKLVDVVTVADVDAEDRVSKILLQILMLRFGHKAKLLLRL